MFIMSMINNSTPESPVKNGGDDINPTCYKDFDNMTFLRINHNYFKLTDVGNIKERRLKVCSISNILNRGGQRKKSCVTLL